MGGTVAETIRKENGELIKMARKTGAYNWMFFSKDFNNGEVEKAIADHVEKFYEMKRDFETGEPYEFAMSPVYGWCNETAPVDYGLVVIDFQNKKIHSMQGYDHPATVYSIKFSPYLVSEDSDDYKFLAQNNLLQVYDGKMNCLGDVHTVFGSENTYEAIQKMVEDSHNPVSSIKGFFGNKKMNPMDVVFMPKVLKDFELNIYEESPEGLIDFLSNLKADGFSFNEEEVKMWKEHFNLCEYGCENLSDEEAESLNDEQIEEAGKKYEKEFLDKIDAIVSGQIPKSSKAP